MEHADQRAGSRVSMSVFVNQEFGEEDRRLGMTVDVSRDGMSVVTLPHQAPPPAGKHAWLRFWLPGSDILIHALAEVVHRSAADEVDRFGLRFKYLFPDQKELLQGYLAGTA